MSDVTRGTRPCDGADDPRERCGFHHQITLAYSGAGGYGYHTCCCDARWDGDGCTAGGKDGDRVSLRDRLHATLAYTVTDTPHDIDTHTDAAMSIVLPLITDLPSVPLDAPCVECGEPLLPGDRVSWRLRYTPQGLIHLECR